MPVIYVDNKDALPKRHKDDKYSTPEKVVRSILEPYAQVFNATKILDVGCGEGIWGAVARELWSTSTISGIDIRGESITNLLGSYDEIVIDDFTTFNYSPHKFNFIMGNPPFKFAEKFVRKSFELIEDTGIISFLLPLDFLASVGRMNGLFIEHPLSNLRVSARRIDYYEKSTNPRNDAVFTWIMGNKFPYPTIHWFDYKE